MYPLTEKLRTRYCFEDWAGRNTLDEELFVWRFLLRGHEVPGWERTRSERIHTGRGPALTRSLWHRSDEPPDRNALLSVDVLECASRAAACELLLAVLGEYESPMLRQEQTPRIGDVLFKGPDAGVAVFSRANLVITVRKAGRVESPVAEVALSLDAYLISKPEVNAVESEEDGSRAVTVGAPALNFRMPEGEVLIGAPVALDIDVASDIKVRSLMRRERAPIPEGTDEPRTMVKFFSATGAIHREEEQPMYTPLRPGRQEILASAEDLAGTSSVRLLRFRARRRR